MATYTKALAEAVTRSIKCPDTTYVVVFEASDSRHASDMYRCTYRGAFGIGDKTKVCGEAKKGNITHQISNFHQMETSE